MSRQFASFFVDKHSGPRRKPKSSRVRSWIGLGSNQGNRPSNITRALQKIQQAPGARVRRVSSLYETEPVGGPPQRAHLNGVAEIETTLSMAQLGLFLLKVEKELGRRRGIRWGPRVLDLDILTFGRLIVRRGRFVVPHPRYHLRRFVLVPLCELAPGVRHPLLQETHRRLLARLTVVGQRVTMAARWKNARFYPFKRRKKAASRSSR